MLKEKQIKVLVLPAWYPSEEHPEAGIFVREHAKAIMLYDDVVVLYVTPANNTMREHYALTDELDKGVRTIRVKYRQSPIPYTKYLLFWLINIIMFRRLIKEGYRPDIIHAHVFSAGVPAVIIGRLYQIPVIITEHYSGFKRHILSKMEIIMARYAMKRTSIVLPVSNDLKKYIKEYGIDAQFEVIPNVVDTDLFHVEIDEISNEKRCPKKLLTVALLVPVKGIPYLLKAVYNLYNKRQDFILDIVGDGPNRMEYEKNAEELKLNDVIRFQGMKKKPEVAEFMRKCDIFVLPSLFETFGVVLIEALSCGKPVIATNSGGPNEIITKENGILVPPANIEELSKALDYMLDHYNDYEPMTIARYVQERYSYKSVGLQLDIIYQRVIDNYKKANRSL